MVRTIQFIKAYALYATHRGRHRRLSVLRSYLTITLIEVLRIPRKAIPLLDMSFAFPDAFWMRALVEELIVGHAYSVWAPSTEAPLIVDAGANIGMATLYFKRLFPRARVISIEPNPISLECLQKNAAALDGVEVVAAALSADGRPLWLSGEHAMATVDTQQGSGAVAVESRRLQSLVPAEETIDILKLDVEGAELEVLQDAGVDLLKRVDQLLAEIHLYYGRPDPLPPILSLLAEAGHRYRIMHWNQGQIGAVCLVHSWRGTASHADDVPLFI